MSMRSIVMSVLLFFVVFTSCFGQTKINPATQVNWPLVTGMGAPSAGTCVHSGSGKNEGQPYTDVLNNIQYNCSASGWIASGGTSGTVSAVSSGDLSPLFTVAIANPTTTPAITFTLSNAAAHSVYGNFTGSSAAPAFSTTPTFAVTNLTGTGAFSTTGQAGTVNTIAGNVTFSTGLSVTGAGTLGSPYVVTASGGTTTTGTGFWHNTAGTLDSASRAVNLASADVTGLLPNSSLATPPITLAAVAHNFLTSYTATSGLYTQAQPAFTDISGTLAAAQCPVATTSAFGCVKPDGTSVTISGGIISAPGAGGGTVTTSGSPASGNLTRFSGPTAITNGDLSGDVTTSGTLATSVVRVNGAAVPVSTAVVGTNSSGQIIAVPAQAANTVYGNFTGSSASPTFSATPTFAVTNLTGTGAFNTSGNAGTATILQTARTINGVSFNGSANITVTAAPFGSAGGALSGSYPNPTIAGLSTVGFIPQSDGAGNLQASVNFMDTFGYLNLPIAGINMVGSFPCNGGGCPGIYLNNTACSADVSANFLGSTGNAENSIFVGHIGVCFGTAFGPPDISVVAGTGSVHQVPGSAFAAVTNLSITSNVVTVTAANSYTIGQYVVLFNLTTSTFLNNQRGAPILSASSTQFTFAFTHANVAPTSETGSADVVADNIIAVENEGSGHVDLGGNENSGTTLISLRTGLDPNGIFFPQISTSGLLYADASSGQGKLSLATTAQQTITINTTPCVLGSSCTVTGGGSMTWPTTPGITVCTGTPCAAWGTSLTAPSGTIVGTTDTQTLTNKSISASQINSGQLGVPNGGTGAATFTIHGVLTGQTAGAFHATAAGATNSVFMGQGASADPIWVAQPVIDCTNCTNVPVGTPTFPWTINGGVTGGLAYGSTNTQLTISPAGAVGTVVLWGGPGAAPTASTATIAPAGTVIPTIFGAVASNRLAQFSGTAGAIIDSGVATGSLVLLTGTQTITATKTFTPLQIFSGIEMSGTKFTTTGCSVSSTTGGGTAGVFTLGANSCTVIITMNGATGLTAANGWSCDAHDRTTAAALIGGETSSTVTTASITVPVTAGATDVISFSCTAY